MCLGIFISWHWFLCSRNRPVLEVELRMHVCDTEPPVLAVVPNSATQCCEVAKSAVEG